MDVLILFLLLVVVGVAAYYTYTLSSQTAEVLNDLEEIRQNQNNAQSEGNIAGRWKLNTPSSGIAGSGTNTTSSSSTTFTIVTPPITGLKPHALDLSNLQLDTLTQVPPNDTIVLLGTTITFKKKGIYNLRISGSIQITNANDFVYVGVTNLAGDSILGMRRYAYSTVGVYLFDVATKVAVTENENLQIFAANNISDSGSGVLLGGLSIIEI